MNGWISLHRQIQNHWIWKDPNKFKWWIDILLTVNNSNVKVNIGNELFDCKRGQSIMSLSSWADRWKVSKDTARNFLKLLELDGMIHTENLIKTTRLTVCKFDTYQQVLHDSQTRSKRVTYDSQTRSDPNNKEDKEDKEDNIYSGFSFFENGFEKIWKNYLDMRIKIKKPATKNAELLVLKKLSRLSNNEKEKAKQIVEQSIVNSWQDVFELRQPHTKTENRAQR